MKFVREQQSDSSHVYFGWYVLAVVFIGQMLTIGLLTYSFGLFVAPVSAEFGLSRANTNIGAMIILFGMSFGAPFVGQLVDRYSARRVMIIGLAMMSAGLASIAMAKSPLTIAALLLFPVSLSAVTTSHLMTSTIVSRWFFARRGRALGIAALSGSLSGIVVVKTFAHFINAYGWRAALGGYALFEFLVVGALALFILRDRPSDMGLPIDGSRRPLPRKAPFSRTAGPMVGWRFSGRRIFG